MRCKPAAGTTPLRVSATVTVNGKRVKTLRGRRLSSPITLKGLPKGVVTVKIAMRTKSGKTCSTRGATAPARPAGRAPSTDARRRAPGPKPR